MVRAYKKNMYDKRAHKILPMQMLCHRERACARLMLWLAGVVLYNNNDDDDDVGARTHTLESR